MLDSPLNSPPQDEACDPDIRQVLVVRRDLNMRRGKLAAQAAHAAMGAFTRGPGARFEDGSDGCRLVLELDAEAEAWLKGRFKKICLCVDNEAQLLELHAKAQAAGLRASLILDAGLTEFKEPTHTVLSIGPHAKAKLDPLTGGLVLY